MWMFSSNRDDQIIARVLSGDREQFGVLVRRYLPAVEAITRAQLGPAGDYDDAVQETFLRAYLNLDQLRERQKFCAWLAAIARNAATTVGNQRRKLVPVQADGEHAIQDAPDFTREELRATVRAELEELDTASREVLLLKYFAGKRSREIAQILELSEPAVRKRLQRARDTLGDRLLSKLEDHAPESPRRKKRESVILGAALASGAAWEASAGVTALASPLAVAIAGGAAKLTVAVAGLGLVAGGAVLVLNRGGAPTSTEAESAPALQVQSAEAQEPSSSAPAQPADVTEAVETQTETVSTAAVAATAPSGVPVRGRVVHTDGTPVADATVLGAYWGRKPRVDKVEARTGDDGAFTLYLDMPWQKFLIWAEKENYTRIKQDEYEIDPDGSDGIMFTLYRAASIDGRLTASTGVKLEALPVTVRNKSVEAFLWTESAETDETGNFHIGGLPPGDYSLAITKEFEWSNDLELFSTNLEEGEALTGVQVPYGGPGLTLDGHVTAEDGTPIEGVFVQLLNGWDPRDTNTDAEGYYRLEQLPEGAFSLTASHREYMPVS